MSSTRKRLREDAWVSGICATRWIRRFTVAVHSFVTTGTGTSRWLLRSLPHSSAAQSSTVRIPRNCFVFHACLRCIPPKISCKLGKRFLEVERRIAEARQFCVPLVRHNYGSARRRITFEIDATSATLDGSPENYLNQDDFWQRAKRARNEDIKPRLIRRSKLANITRTIEEVEVNGSIIRVRLERDLADHIAQGRYRLPAG